MGDIKKSIHIYVDESLRDSLEFIIKFILNDT